jgi:hypothetical protein
MQGGFGLRVAYTLQQALATATDAFLLNRLVSIDPVTGDTVRPARAEFPLDYDRRHTVTAVVRGQVAENAGPELAGIRFLGGLESAAILRYGSGLPFTRTNAAGDSLIGLPNDARLPASMTIDLLVRRPIRLGGVRGGLYVDVRNLLNRRNIVTVRRDTGEPGLTAAGVDSLAEAAYQLHPEEIPFESARYRGFADANGDGYLSGREELFPLYQAAARDFTQPLFAYGPPRLVRLGLEFLF